MESRLLGVASVAVCLLCLASPYFAKPLTQNIELSSEDRLYYFGQTEVQDFELVSPNRWSRAAPGKATKHNASFEAFGEDFNLHLKGKKGLIDAATVLHKVGQDGKVELSQISNDCDLFEGTSKKHDQSQVSASICGDKIEATVKTKEAVFHIQPLLPKHQELMANTVEDLEVDMPLTKNMHMVQRRSVNIEACDMEAERTASNERQRRSTIEEPIYVEASVVADDMMYATYGTNTEEYILTILNQVAGMLKDPSLGVQVNLRITDIKIIQSPQENLQLSANLDKSLDNFCSWQMDSKSDISILITRRDLVSAGSHQVMGKAKDVGGACDPKRRCVIGQDHGPSGLIFTLTHEIGHSLGMYHDGGLSDCVNKKNVMATVHSTGPEAFQWSECSRNDLLDFLSRPESKCLKDKPKALQHTPSTIPMPGFHYNASQQCAMTFNKGSLVASEVLNKPEICKALLCKTGKGAPESTQSPPLDGTRCGTKRDICIQGECLKVYSTLVCNGGECIPFWLTSSFVCDASTCIATRSVLCVEQHDDGTTNRVTDLTRCPADIPAATQPCEDNACRYSFVISAVGGCSVTCGVGFQTRTIICQDATNQASVSESLCNINERPASTQNCNTGVVCPSTVSYFLGQFGECSVTCGTGLETRSVTCRNNLGVIVNDIDCTNAGLVRPPATQPCSVNVACTENIRYIAGQLSGCSVTCGTGVQTRQIYCVNQENRVVANSVCEAADLAPLATEVTCTQVVCPVNTFSVVRGDYGACSVSCGTGVETRVVVCLNQNGQQVAMESCINFGLSDLDTERVCTLPACAPLLSYRIGAYTDCSVTCGAGVRTRDVQCVNQNDEIVDVQGCLDLNLIPPVSTIVCTLGVCPTYFYQFGTFGECSETCGDGLRMRTVICINNDTSEIVGDGNCPGEKPATTEPCNLQSCDVIYQFVSGPFGACNCSGIQTRLVICISRTGNDLVRVDDQTCLDNGIVLPALTRGCAAPSNCLNPVWQTSDFNGCSVTCDIGFQNRLVYCVEFPGSSVLVADSLCVSGDKPSATQPCNTGVECPTEYLWLAYGWGDCSVTCGGGFELRDVFCFNLNQNFAQVNDSLCVLADKPVTVRTCNPDPCTASWTTSAWTECSVTCGPGEESRSVVCRATKDPASNLVDETECISEDRPSETRSCFLEICPSPFGCNTTTRLEGILQYSESSPGFGNNENYPNDFDCDKSFAAPIVRNRNFEVPAEYYIRLTFTAFDLEASENCQFDFLEVRDVFENTTELLCGNSYDLPLVWNSNGPLIDLYFHTDATTTAQGYSVTYNAVLKEVPSHYETSEWSECSVTCGEGVETRSVVCYRGNETVDESECSELQRPTSMQPCEEDVCIQPNACSGDLIRTEDGSVLQSPEFSLSYPNNVSCFNRIQAPEGMVVQLDISFFNLRFSSDCEVDSVKISDFNADGEALSLCGNQEPGTVFTSTSNEVIVAFSSNETGVLPDTGFGFSLVASFILDPGSRCSSEIMTSGQAVFSPNYPNEYGPNENCVTVIRNDGGCISLQFLDFNIHANPDGTCQDFLQLVDLTQVSLNTPPLCGDELPLPFYSASGLITVRFVSNGSIADTGYNAVSRFVECTEGLWFTSEFTECSATCGEAFQIREVNCQKPSDNSPVDPASCPPDRPDAIRECVVPDCPSCDVVVDQSGKLIESLKTENLYSNDQLCTTTISNPEGCVSIGFLSFELQNPMDDGCEADYLEIIDSGRDTPMRFCGLDSPGNYLSLSGDVTLVFKTDGAIVGPGYVAYVTFVPCPINAFIPGNWSECSVTCGSGIRTRVVECMDLLNNVPADDSLCNEIRPPCEEACETEMECPTCYTYVNETGQFLTSPGFPAGYANNLDCVYEFESPDDSLCVRIVFLETYLNGLNDDGQCDGDVITVEGEDTQVPFVFCPESARSVMWNSNSNTAMLRFTTDESDTAQGFNMYNIFDQCPEYKFEVGPFGACNARCGGGIQERDVQCIAVADNSEADPALCRNAMPPATRLCNTQPCEDCDASFGPGDTLVSSPGFRDPYLTTLDCTYNITNPEGCLFLTFLDFDVQDCAECVCDSLTIIEEGAATLPPLCGLKPLETYQSSTGDVQLRFISDEMTTAGGFNIFISYSPCPDTFYFTGEYSECDVSCGGGVQTRDVYCKSRSMDAQVDSNMCSGVRPPSTQPCGEEACPFCDEEVTSFTFVMSPGFPAEYPISINCNYRITAPDDQCVSVRFVTFDLEEGTGQPPVCDGDFVELEDLSTPALTMRFCGSSSDYLWLSRSKDASLLFSSDEENTAPGFRAYVSFIECPAFGYSVGEFSLCSRPCGGGMQVREVTCRDLETMETVEDSMCPELKPEDTRPCNVEPCPECDELILTERQEIFSLNFPQPYFEYSCNYLYNNPGGCVELLFIQFELPEPNADGICNKDYLLVEDISDQPFSYRVCGRSNPNSVTSRGPTLNVTLITDGLSSTFGEGYQLYNLFTPSCPTSGYVAEAWQECDRECGGGTRQRNVNCLDLLSGIVVDEQLCIDRKPVEMELCNSQPCPSCDQVIDSLPLSLLSPNHPESFDPQRTCKYNITSSRCLRISFLEFSLPAPVEGRCGDTYVQIEDVEAEFLNQRFCGDGPMRGPGDFSLYSWDSRSGQVMVTLNSGEIFPDPSRFQFYLSEVDCPEYGFISGNFSECSVTCGEGALTRSVECMRLATMEVVNDDLCMDPKPAATRPCPPQPPCPSCDALVDISMSGSTVIMAPPRDGTWTADVNCEYTIQEQASCVQVSALSLDLADPDENNTCSSSVISIRDGIYTDYKQEYCGSDMTPLFLSLSSNATVVFSSENYEASTDNFALFVRTYDCPSFMYRAGDFSVCSVSCGGGTMTREVTCERTDLNTEVPESLCTDSRPSESEDCNVFVCPQECNRVLTESIPILPLTAPTADEYQVNGTCINNIAVQFGSCVIVNILSVDIEETSPGVCDGDYLAINDANSPAINLILCGQFGILGAWRSQSSIVQIVSVTDSMDNRPYMFELTYSFADSCPTGVYETSDWNPCSVSCGGGQRTRMVECKLPDDSTGSVSDCPGLPPASSESCSTEMCPEFYYFTGDYSACSVTCDNGVQTRTVECRATADDAVVTDDMCSDTKPEATMVCSLALCNDLVVNEPSSSRTLLSGDTGTITSPNYPNNYPDNLNGELVLTIPMGTILKITITAIDLVFDVPCNNGDSINISSGTSTLSICSALSTPTQWFSSPDELTTTITFITSATNPATGFTSTYEVLNNV